ncbi:TetR family transcriptional regulator [Kineococcus sp. NPDC059986]|uniref:TetR/AcrR family transcriptional regulator n=1 Tax=Kineococcus sp. NPDC059986 TaxID=3155538 RepID=UPI00344BDD64
MERSRPRGRPPATSASAIAATALRLFAERGYEATTMDDVAKACGIARRTLFSYYPSKGAIVWEGRPEATGAIAAALAAVPAATPWRTALVETLPTALVFPDGDEALLRARLALIAGNADLQSHLFVEQSSFTDGLVAFVAAREPGDELGAAVAAHTTLAALSAALQWWATTEGHDLRATLRRALTQVLAPGSPAS